MWQDVVCLCVERDRRGDKHGDVFVTRYRFAVFSIETSARSATTTAAAVLPPVAVANGVSILSNQLDQAMLAPHRPNALQLCQFLKQELIARELFRQKAEAAHYDVKPEVQQVVNAARIATET